MGKLKTYILAFDQGTSSSRSILFDENFQVAGIEQKETRSFYAQPGWVEQDAEEIWQNQLLTAKTLLKKLEISAKQIAAIGITNQRETTVVWDDDGKPVYPAIVWQDKRTAPHCRKMEIHGLKEVIREKTGLVINPYFSATKIAWIINNVEGVRSKAAKGKIHAGTIDSWLVWNLTGGRQHITDCSNASRTMLFNINKLDWDFRLCNYFMIHPKMLPEVKSSAEIYGTTDASLFGKGINISGIAGDQQAALFGQQCHQKGMAKNTYGTGCFLLMNTGEECILSKSGLLTTIAWKIKDKVNYALEGSIFMGGALIKWLRDELQIISSAAETEKIAASLADNNGVYFVPAFNGLGAPHWDTEAKGMICGLTGGSGKAQIVRAALEALAFQTHDVLKAMEKDAGISLKHIKVDGGAAANNFLMQFQADILGNPVIRAEILESTALGAALLAAEGCNLADFKTDDKKQNENVFQPKISEDKRTELISGWNDALKRSRL